MPSILHDPLAGHVGAKGNAVETYAASAVVYSVVPDGELGVRRHARPVGLSLGRQVTEARLLT